MRNRLTIDEYVQGIRTSNRLVLSQAITLIESYHPTDRAMAQGVLERILPYAGNSQRIGITGVPGVGKSTFTDALGLHMISQHKRVAVLAIDPTSQLSKGSLLGDKTRMEQLSRHPMAYVRPSPTRTAMGGVAQSTRESILLCEAAGFDIILIETVGVGQSETIVAEMVDFFLVLILASAGDELQGIKRGIMELADALVITKVDGSNIQPAQKTKIDYQNALQLFRPNPSGWLTPVLTSSALTGNGIMEVWEILLKHHSQMVQNGHFLARRHEQQIAWFRSLLTQRLSSFLSEKPGFKKFRLYIEEQIQKEKLLPFQGVEQLIQFANLK